MLVLTRKKGQSIVIDDKIEITILETKGEQIKIGIEAPKNINILRKEVYLEVKEENQAAIGLSKVDVGELQKIFAK